MEGFIAIIFIIFSVIAAANGNKKKQAARKRPPMPTTRRPDPLPVDPQNILDEDDEDEGVSHDDGKCVGGSITHTVHQGESVSDGACVGGSIPHDTHEGGESIDPIPEPHTEEERETLEGARYTAEDMREAFIASEIFARPKALRRN